MKKKMKRFAEGGYSDQEASDLMEKNIVPTRASTYSGIMASGDTSGWTKDELEALKANEAAEAKPARKAAPAPKAKANTSSQAEARAAEPKETPDYSDQNSRSVRSEKKESKPSPAGDTERNGPIGDLMDEAKKNVGKKTPYRAGKRYAGQEGGSSLKYKAGGSVKSSGGRGDGLAQRGKTKGTMR